MPQSHTFDENTLIALKEESDIRIISDTIANDVYFENWTLLYSAAVRTGKKLPFKTVTFCYHPNMMENGDIEHLELFLKDMQSKFVSAQDAKVSKRQMSTFDRILRAVYFAKRRQKL